MRLKKMMMRGSWAMGWGNCRLLWCWDHKQKKLGLGRKKNPGSDYRKCGDLVGKMSMELLMQIHPRYPCFLLVYIPMELEENEMHWSTCKSYIQIIQKRHLWSTLYPNSRLSSANATSCILVLVPTSLSSQKLKEVENLNNSEQHSVNEC